MVGAELMSSRSWIQIGQAPVKVWKDNDYLVYKNAIEKTKNDPMVMIMVR